MNCATNSTLKFEQLIYNRKTPASTVITHSDIFQKTHTRHVRA